MERDANRQYNIRHHNYAKIKCPAEYIYKIAEHAEVFEHDKKTDIKTKCRDKRGFFSAWAYP